MLKPYESEDVFHDIGYILSENKLPNDLWPFSLKLTKQIFYAVVIASSFRKRLRIVIFMKGYITGGESDKLLWVIFTVYDDLPSLVTEIFEIAFRNIVMLLLLHLT
jgi:hypothetical protein